MMASRKWIRNIRVFFNVLSVVILLVIVLPKLEKWIFLPKVEGLRAPSSVLSDLDDQVVDLPVEGSKQIYIFWASWCTPCTAELAMYNYAIKNNLISADQVVAIAFGEKVAVVRSVAHMRDYKFKVYVDPWGEVARKFGVDGTPTSVFVDKDGFIQKFSTGVSPLVFASASNFLKD